MAGEARFWSRLRAAMIAEGAVVQKHNDVTPGVWDVSYVFDREHRGWLELKSVPAPARPETPVRLGLTREQVLWGCARLRAGDDGGVLAKVGGVVYLLSLGVKIEDAARGRPAAWLQQNCERYWCALEPQVGPMEKRIARYLKTRRS